MGRGRVQQGVNQAPPTASPESWWPSGSGQRGWAGQLLSLLFVLSPQLEDRPPEDSCQAVLPPFPAPLPSLPPNCAAAACLPHGHFSAAWRPPQTPRAAGEASGSPSPGQLDALLPQAGEDCPPLLPSLVLTSAPPWPREPPGLLAHPLRHCRARTSSSRSLILPLMRELFETSRLVSEQGQRERLNGSRTNPSHARCFQL